MQRIQIRWFSDFLHDVDLSRLGRVETAMWEQVIVLLIERRHWRYADLKPLIRDRPLLARSVRHVREVACVRDIQHFTNLRNVVFDDCGSEPMDLGCFGQLTTLRFRSESVGCVTRLPPTLTHLDLSGYPILLTQFVLSPPPPLQFIGFGTNLCEVVRPGSLPASVHSISFYAGCTQFEPLALEGVSRLTIIGHSSHALTQAELPTTLVELEIVWGNMCLDAIVLPKLHKLCLGSDFNRLIQHACLPDSLQVLLFGDQFNHPLPPLPPNLRYLRLGQDFNQPFSADQSKLHTLLFGSGFRHIVEIPQTVKVLALGNGLTQRFPTELCWLSFTQLPTVMPVVPMTLLELWDGGEKVDLVTLRSASATRATS